MVSQNDRPKCGINLTLAVFSYIVLWNIELEFLLQATEIHNFNQDDLMTEDVFILDCHSDIYVWVGQQVEPKNKHNALDIGEVSFQFL